MWKLAQGAAWERRAMSENSSDGRAPSNEVEGLLNDIFGLNIRGLKTLWFTFAKPARVFDVARQGNWTTAGLTPTIRLLFSVFALLAAFRFFWAKEDGFLFQAVLQAVNAQTDTAQNLPQNVDASAVTSNILSTIVLVLPVAMTIGLVLGGSALSVWGKGTRATQRIRLFFTAIIPGYTLNALFTITLLSAISQQFLLIFSFLILFMQLVIDTITSLRGGVVAGSTQWRFAKAVGVGLTNIVASNLAIVLVIFFAIFWTEFQMLA